MVQVASQEEAAAAIEAFNGQTVIGPAKTESSAGQTSEVLQVKFLGQNEEPSDGLYLTGVPSSVDQATLNQMFTAQGFTVQRSKIIADTKGRGVTAAMVQVGSVEEARAAIEAFNGQTVVAPDEPMPAAGCKGGGKGGAFGAAVPASDGVLQVKFLGANQDPSDGLYLTGVPSNVDQATLNQMFTAQGFTVQRSKIIADTKGRGVTAAMVQVGSVEEARAAIEAFNGQTVVAPDEPMPAAGCKGGGKGGAFGAAVPASDGVLQVKFLGANQDPSDGLYLTGVPSNVDQATLNQMFEAQGFTVQRSKIIADTKGRGVTAAMVQVGSVEEARAAIEAFNGQTVVAPDEPMPAAGCKGGGKGGAFGAAVPASDGVLQVKFLGANQDPSDGLYLTGVPSNVDQATLNQMFESQGFTVQRSKIVPDTKGRAGCKGGGKGGAFGAAVPASDGVLQVKFLGANQDPSDGLYLTGVPSNVDQATLNQMFESQGFTVQRSKIVPDTKGRGITAAMVQLASVDEARAAIEAFNGQTVIGPDVPMSAAGTAQNAGKGYGKGGAYGAAAPASEGVLQVKFLGQSEEPNDGLYLTGVPSSVDQATLNQMFEAQGFTVQRSKIVPDTKGRGITAAMVQLASVDEARAAIEAFNGQTVIGPDVPMSAAAAAPSAGKGGAKGCGGAASASEGVLQLKFAGQNNEPSDNLYITGLPNSVDQALLNQMFSDAQFTVQRSRIIPDSRGTGFSAAMVQVGSVEEATAAIAAFHGQSVIGPDKTESVARAPAPKTGGEASGVLQVKFLGQNQDPSDGLYLTGVPSTVDQATLNQMFTAQGFTVQRSKIIADTKGRGVTAAMVQVASVDEARAAIEAFNGQTVIGPDEPMPAAAAATPPNAGKGFGKGSGAFGTAAAAAAEGKLQVKYAGQMGSPSDNLYLAGLPATVDETLLNQMFTGAGFSVQRSKIIPDTRGLGFAAAMVQVGSQQEAAAAIEAFNGQTVLGPEKPTAPSPRPAQNSGNRRLTVKYAGQGQPSDNLFVAGLPHTVDQSTVEQMFTSNNFNVVRSRLLQNGAAMVQLSSMQEAAAAIEAFHGQEVVADGSASAGDASAKDVEMSTPRAAPASQDVNMLGNQAAAQQASNGAAAQPAAKAATLTVRYAGAQQQASDNVYVIGLPGSTMEQSELAGIFASVNLTMKRAKVLPDTKGTGFCKAMVQLQSQADAAKAIEALNGREIVVG
eukprot:TRINITY_DN940_c0_g1_i2.p1 TRINITY_DN940_c0_g1~~TRINITY_DN940_c0_g1_i2.p1  ORF type:complete len:1251 (-),score=304.53 TRINITY_DN940_c0_g1_i2:140-3784(-)